MSARSECERRFLDTNANKGMVYEGETFNISLTYTPDWIDYDNLIAYEIKKYIDSVSQRTLVAMAKQCNEVYTQWDYYVLVEVSIGDVESHNVWKYEHLTFKGSGKLSGKQAVLWLRSRGVKVIPWNRRNMSLWHSHRNKIKEKK